MEFFQHIWSQALTTVHGAEEEALGLLHPGAVDELGEGHTTHQVAGKIAPAYLHTGRVGAGDGGLGRAGFADEHAGHLSPRRPVSSGLPREPLLS